MFSLAYSETFIPSWGGVPPREVAILLSHVPTAAEQTNLFLFLLTSKAAWLLQTPHLFCNPTDILPLVSLKVEVESHLIF